MKRFVAILMTISIFLIMGTGCFGCNGCFGCGAKANPRVAVVLPESIGDDLLKEAEETMKSMSGQHGIEYIFKKFPTQDEQASIIDTLVGWRANAIVMWPVDASSADDKRGENTARALQQQDIQRYANRLCRYGFNGGIRGRKGSRLLQ